MTLDERVEIQYAAERDPAYRQMVLAMIDDPDCGDAFFINAFCTTYDPRNDPETGKPVGAVPFLLWPEQEEAARLFGAAMDGSYDCGTEKPRDWGITWIILACIVKRWIRTPGFSALVGAVIQDLLDNEKSHSTLFWKIKCLVQYVFVAAPWLKPKNFDYDIHHTWAALTNPEIGSTIVGRAPTVRFPVGDRQSVIYFDDFAQWEVGAEAWENAAATTNCRIASWTPNGTNFAWELRFGKGRFENVKLPIVKADWQSDPRKQRTMVDPQTGRVYNVWKREMIGDVERGIPGKISFEQFQRDYEHQYETAQKGRIYGSQMPHVGRGKFPYNPTFPLWSATDYGRTDDCVILWPQLDPQKLRFRIVDFIARNGQGIEFYVPFYTGREGVEVLKHEKDYTLDDLKIIERHTSWQAYDRIKDTRAIPYYDHYGDPAGKAKSISHNKSAKDMLWEAGIEVKDLDNNEAKSYKYRVECARFILRYTDIDAQNCEDVILAFNAYKWDKSGEKPEHDQHSHICAAWEYFCVNIIDWFRELLAERQQERKAISPEQNYAIFGVSAEEANLIRKMESRRLEDAGSGGVYYPARADSTAGY